MSDAPVNEPRESNFVGTRTFPWLSWVIGAAACVALALVVTHRAEEEQFVRLVKNVKLSWLALALLFQAGTYLTQGLVWREAALARGSTLGIGKTFQLSLATLFVDQALPSGGLSGMGMASGALSRMGVPRSSVSAAVLVNLGTYSVAYAFCVASAIGLGAFQNHLPTWVTMAMLAFVALRLGIAAFVISVPGGGFKSLRARLSGLRKAQGLLVFLRDAPVDSFHDRKLLLQAFALHVGTFLLDAATLWVAVSSLGYSASASGIFTAFMASTFFRTVGVLPGGLGTFETASVVSLGTLGIPLPLALSATLLFRGLSFWLPMIPGMFCSRRLLGKPRRIE